MSLQYLKNHWGVCARSNRHIHYLAARHRLAKMCPAHDHTVDQSATPEEGNLGVYSGVGDMTSSSSSSVPQLTPEIVNNIFEQLAPINLATGQSGVAYQPLIRRFLQTCLFVSKHIREFALRRLFQSLMISSTIPRIKMHLLCQLLSPPPDLQWMSMIPYIRFFRLTIYSDFRATVMHARPEDFLPLFHAMNARDSGCRIASFAFRNEHFFERPFSFFTAELRVAVSQFLKLSTLQSLEIHGGFLVPNFLLGTRVLHLRVSSYTFDSESGPMDDAAHSLHPGAAQNYAYPELQSLMTDTTFPEGTIADNILRNVKTLGLTISDTSAVQGAEALISRTSPSVTNLMIIHMLTYRPSHEAIPTHWNINFGALQALETLDLPWSSYFNTEHDATQTARNRPLAFLKGLLDTVHNPMHNLTTIRWIFRFFIVLDGIVGYDLATWLMPNGTLWDALDKKLSSNLFPSLQSVQLTFNFPAVYGEEEVLYEHPDFETEFFGRMREAYFPRLVASLREKFKFEAKREIVQSRI